MTNLNEYIISKKVKNKIIKQVNKSIRAMVFLPMLVFAETPAFVEIESTKAWRSGANHIIHCKVQSPNLYQLSSHSSAKLTWLLPEGTLVQKGQLVAEQDGYYLERNIERLKIEIATANAQQKYIEEEYQRLIALEEKQLISPSLLNDTAHQFTQTKLSLKMLVEQLKEAHYRQKNLQHFSPVNAQILIPQVLLGQQIGVGQNIVKLQPTDNKELVCELPLTKYRQNSQLKKAIFTLMDKINLSLSRHTVSLKEDSQTLKIYLSVTQENQKLILIGERLEVQVGYQTSDLVRIPHDALELAENAYYVWQLNNQNKVNRIPVSIISTQSQHFVVKSSIDAGDKVVTFGKQGLIENQDVRWSGMPITISKGASL